MKIRWLGLALIWVACAGQVAPPADPSESSESAADAAEASRITVSGISAGGYLATQLHIAYSDLFSGAAILAAGPYGCANGDLMTAMTRCMGKVSSPLPLDEFETSIREAFETGKISDPVNLADDEVWIYRGKLDPLVAAEVSEALRDLYLRFLPSENLLVVNDVEAIHHFPTLSKGHACDQSESPYIAACDFDGAGELLEHLYGPLREPQEIVGTLSSATVAGASDAGLMEEAWTYVPRSCETTAADCRIHVALHGCLQSVEKVDKAFMEQTGYLRWAESNDIVLLFPQIRSSAVNPYGCWDWWGYTGPDYRYRDGKQMKAIVGLVEELAAQP